MSQPDHSSAAATAADSAARPHRRSHWPALHWQILIGLVVGALAGLAAEGLGRGPDGLPDPRLTWAIENVARPLGQIFLNLIYMVMLPLVFSALVLGVAGIGDVRRLGRVGLKTLAYTVALSAISVTIGVTLTKVIQPGAHVSAEQRAALSARYQDQTSRAVAQAHGEGKSTRDALLDLIPRNPLREMVGADNNSSGGGGMLAVMFFALVFGVALTLAPQRTQPLIGVLEGIYDVVMVIVGMAMRLAPLAVAAMVFALSAQLGGDILRILAWYVLTVLAGLGLHFFGVYSLLLIVMARINPVRFLVRVSDAVLTAFGTSSSNATLPVSLRVTEQNLGVRRDIASFVLTVGSTANQNGTALYEGVTVLFLAQVFGADLGLAEQIKVAVMCVLAGIGTAGVPSGSLPLIVVVLQSVGVPAEYIGIILGVDRLLDMCRTTLNVTGDIAVAACVDRSEAPQTAVKALATP